MAASVLSTGPAAAAAALTADIVVHAGGTRSSVTSVSGLSGATFTAVPVVAGGAGFTCVTDAAGTCTITVPTGLTSGTRLAYVVSETAPPAGWYLNPNLDYGNSSSGSPTPYVFTTGPLVNASTVNVPGATAEGSYNDAGSPGKPSTGLLATSLNNPQAPTACGLKIALILDQSGSMTSGTKQADLKVAAKKVITTLTGTPSQMAIYTFGAATGGSVALTTLGSTAQAAPLTNFINGLPTPSGGTNWDRGLAQAVTATKQYDLVVVLTDGNPTTDHTGSGGNSNTNFHNVENGIYSANAIKNLGSRLVAIGIGVNGGQDNLRAISGPSLNSDYYLGTSGNFDDVFKALATGNCSGILTVQKQIQDFQGNVITNSPAANGWDFAGTVSSPAAALTFPATATVNGATGFTQTAVSIPAGSTPTVTITETLTGGYTFVGAVCSVGGATVSTTAAGTATSPGVSFAAAANVPLACTFTNKQPPPTSSLTVQKLDATTNAPVAGATFQLYRETTVGTRNPGSDTAVGAPCTTSGSPAQCESLAVLPFGTYYWVETVAPTGYVLPTGTAAISAAYTLDATHTGAPAAMLSVIDAQKLSSLAVRKLDATADATLAGATFQLYREATAGTRNPALDSALDSCTTAGSAPACASSATLTFGTYYWVETAAPVGYVLPAGSAAYSAAYTIDAAHTGTPVTTLSVSDAQATSSLAIKKLDAATSLPVAGASFQLYRETAVGTRNPAADTALGALCVTSGSPAGCVSAALTFGTYYWVETAAPAGYVLPASGTARFSAAYTIDATHTGASVATLTVSDAQKLSSLAVQKLDARTGDAVDGATFQLYREVSVGTVNPALDAAVSTPCTTLAANTPTHTCTVPDLGFGTYYWVETTAPAGYALPSGTAGYSAATTINAASAAVGTTVTLSVSDAQLPSGLAVRKLDATTGNAVNGATFQLYREAAVGTQNPAADVAVGAPCTTAAASPCSATGLRFGTYYWVETDAPSGYVLPAGSAAYSAAQTIDAAYAAAGTVTTLVIFDAQKLSSLAVRKLDTTTNLPVSGATFALWLTGTPDSAVGACTTGAAGSCSVSGLVFGTYYWVETAAPAGYVLPTSPADRSSATTIDAGYAAAGLTATVSVADDQVLSTLTVRKTNESAEVLAGATFQLWLDGTPDTLVAQCTTDDLGTCSVGGLAFGTYHWVETEAPAFYELPDNPVSAPIVVGPDTAGSTFAPTGFADPSMPVATVAKTVQSTTQNANGTWTIVYDLAVTNASAKYPTTYELVDRLSFGHGITISTANVTGPAGADINPGWNGVDDVGIITRRVIGAGVTEHYTVTVTADVGTAATATDRDCTMLSDEAGTGFLNSATISLGAQGSTSTACAAPGSPTVTKKVLSLTPGSIEGNWTIAYAVTVSNATPTDVSYSLKDNPGIALGVETTGTSASWLRSALDGSAPSTSTDVSGWTGVAPDDVLATARVLPAGSKDTYTVTLEMVVPTDLADNVLACSAAGPGHGYFNAATMASGSDTFPVSACAPTHASGIDAIVTSPRPVTPDQLVQGGSLAYTGVQVWTLIWIGIALLIGGVAVLVLIGRRRPEAGDVG